MKGVGKSKEEKSYFESSSIGSLQIGHAFKGQLVMYKLPQHDGKTVGVNLVVIMLLFALSKSYGTVELQPEYQGGRGEYLATRLSRKTT